MCKAIPRDQRSTLTTIFIYVFILFLLLLICCFFCQILFPFTLSLSFYFFNLLFVFSTRGIFLPRLVFSLRRYSLFSSLHCQQHPWEGKHFYQQLACQKGCKNVWTFSKLYWAVLRFCSQISTTKIMKMWPFSLSLTPVTHVLSSSTSTSRWIWAFLRRFDTGAIGACLFPPRAFVIFTKNYNVMLRSLSSIYYVFLTVSIPK